MFGALKLAPQTKVKSYSQLNADQPLIFFM
jgi:hypothetical protein